MTQKIVISKKDNWNSNRYFRKSTWPIEQFESEITIMEVEDITIEYEAYERAVAIIEERLREGDNPNKDIQDVIKVRLHICEKQHKETVLQKMKKQVEEPDVAFIRNRLRRRVSEKTCRSIMFMPSGDEVSFDKGWKRCHVTVVDQ